MAVDAINANITTVDAVVSTLVNEVLDVDIYEDSDAEEKPYPAEDKSNTKNVHTKRTVVVEIVDE